MMTSVESTWVLGLLTALLGALVLFRRLRRGTADYRESRAARARLPFWVRVVEKSLLYLLMMLVALPVAALFVTVHGMISPTRKVEGAVAVYAFLGATLIAFPIAALLANLVSVVSPPLRQANALAMEGGQVSFASANRGLIRFSLVSVPAGVAALTIALFAPWAR